MLLLFIFNIKFYNNITLISFDINDNSFLTKTDLSSHNLLGDLLILREFCILYFWYILSFCHFFLIFSVLTAIDKRPKYIFIRLIIFFISLITLPQILIFYLEEINLISGINNWGIYSHNVFEVTESKIVSFILSSIGLLLFFTTQNIFSLIKIPKVRFYNLFKKNDVPKSSFHKKEPVINS